MVLVLGVDPSLTCTGLCVWHDGRVQTGSIRTRPEDLRVHRQTRIADEVMRHVNPLVPVLAIIEAVYQGGFGRTSLDLAGLHDVLVYEFVRRGVRVGVASPKAVKLFATNNGNARKAAMVAEARALLGVTTKNDNEADALWMATMGVVAMGGQVNGWPQRADHPPAVAAQKRREDTLAKVTWIGGEPGLLLRGT